jgi:hypothetical protein
VVPDEAREDAQRGLPVMKFEVNIWSTFNHYIYYIIDILADREESD